MLEKVGIKQYKRKHFIWHYRKIIQFGLWILFVAFVSVESTRYNHVGNGVAHFFSGVAEEKCEK